MTNNPIPITKQVFDKNVWLLVIKYWNLFVAWLLGTGYFQVYLGHFLLESILSTIPVVDFPLMGGITITFPPKLSTNFFSGSLLTL